MVSLHSNHSDDQAALVLAFRSGDELAFEYFFERHHRSLYWIVYKIVQDQQEAEDIVVETFETLSRNRAKINDADHLGRYLYFVARNAAID